VSLGGGTGLATLLRGLKKRSAELAAVVAVSDDGGSSGRLRDELGVLPPGDIRNCMVAMSEDEALMSRLFQHRFTSTDANGGLHDHSFGNLFVTAMAEVAGDFAEAVRLSSEVLAINGTILLVTSSNVRLRADFDDGEWIQGETRITVDHRRIWRLEMDPSDAEALSEALDRIASADIITLGPGSLYTSMVATLLPLKMVEAIRSSKAKKIYIQNIMTQPAETTGLTTAEHIEALVDHSGSLLFPTALVNTHLPSASILRKYEEGNAGVLEIDRQQVADMGVEIVEQDLLSEGGAIRHDPESLAAAVLNI